MSVSTIRLITLAIMVLMPFGANAQTPQAAAPQTQLLKPAELDQLVAPIALYPDTLLAEVLMASAYPLDIVQAERWVQANKNLAGDQLKAAVDKQPWDASVKSLVATPSVLEMMSTKLDWTEKLGDAVVAQQADVMDAIQRLRAKAQANNKLTSTKEQNVTVQQAEGRQVIAIEPTDPNTVYVPYYDPGVVYGDWPYPEYPPYYFGAPGYIACRHYCDRNCVRRRIRAWPLGRGRPVLGRRGQLGREQSRRQSADRRRQQHRQQMAAPGRTSSENRQSGWRATAELPRQRRAAGAQARWRRPHQRGRTARCGQSSDCRQQGVTRRPTCRAHQSRRRSR